MTQDRNTLQLISDITEFNDLHEYMQDEHLDKALSIVVKLLMSFTGLSLIVYILMISKT